MDQNTVNPAVGTVETAEITETSGQAETGKSGRPKKQKTVEMPRILTVSPAPFVKSPETVSTMMLDVIIALIPALLWGIYVFGFRAAAIAMVSVGSAVLSEAVMRFLLKRSVTIGDLSAAVTGLLLAMLMPVCVPLWIPAVGSCFAIVIVKQLFGGIGNNFVNPALTAWVFLGFFGDHLSAYTMPGEKINSFAMTLAEEELAAAADPLLALKAGHLPESNLFDMMIGNIIDDKDVQDKVGYGKYDIVVANILADVLVALTPVIVDQLKDGGIYITSGIIDDKEETVVEAVKAAGLEVLEVTYQGEWVSVTARKNG